MGRRQRLRARRRSAVVGRSVSTLDVGVQLPTTRAERARAARERVAGHQPACNCGTRPPQNRNWFTIKNFTDAPNRAAIYIYEEIGYWGTSANDFVQQLNQLSVDFLDVHINSPGGEVDDGMAIYNAIRQHRAHVTVYIDGLAASAASFIAMAGDEVVISQFAQMMIHDALGFTFGNAAEMREFADLLDRYSNAIAMVYTDSAGGTVDDWRERMRVETWYTGAEAVTAGLADRVYDVMAGDEDDSDEDGDELMTVARWDLSLFGYRHAGRAAAPAPPLPARATNQATDATPATGATAEPPLAAPVAGEQEQSPVEPAEPAVAAAQAEPEAPSEAQPEPAPAGETADENDVDQSGTAADQSDDAAPDEHDDDRPSSQHDEPHPSEQHEPHPTEPDAAGPEVTDTWAQLTAGLFAPSTPDEVWEALKEGLLT